MSDKNKISTIYSGVTTHLKEGMAVLEDIIVIAPQCLFVLFAYGGKRGSKDMKLAAEYKKIRLKKIYPGAEVRIIDTFKYPSHFKAEWTKLYLELTESETADKYILYEIHYFGHGGPEALYLEEEGGIDGANSKIYFNDSENMERLPWSPNKGIFVLHSCRGAAFEDTLDDKMIEAQACIAKAISENQKIRCLGQTVGASFNIDGWDFDRNDLDNIGLVSIARPIKETTARQDAERFKYRNLRILNAVAILVLDIQRVLWGYALLTGDVYNHAESNQKVYKERFKKSYPMYEEIKILGPKSQIMPCRVFNDGVLEENRIVKAGYFNNNDLEYI